MFKKRLEALDGCLGKCQITSLSARPSMDDGLFLASEWIRETREREGIVYVVGNGGSAGIASHFSNDLIKTLQIPSHTLYDSNLMTCLANDLGYEHVFSFPLNKFLKKEDLLVAISSSGKSPNILNAADVAVERGARLVTLSGFKENNPLRAKGGINFWIDQCDYGLVEASHFFLLHTIVDLWSHFSLRVLTKEKARVN